MFFRGVARTFTVAPAVFAAGLVSLGFAYLSWIAGVQAPTDIVAGTASAVAGAAGYFFPDQADEGA